MQFAVSFCKIRSGNANPSLLDGKGIMPVVYVERMGTGRVLRFVLPEADGAAAWRELLAKPSLIAGNGDGI